MTTLRVNVPAGIVSGRLAALDSSTLTLVSPNGKLTAISRREITSIERRGNNAKAGAKGLAVVGLGVGAVAIGLMAAGLCESSSCDGQVVPAALVGAVVGAAAGAVVGAGLGAMSARWLPVSTDLRMSELTQAHAGGCTSRFELQMARGSETSIIGKGGHVSAAKSCRRGNVGFEWGAVDRPTHEVTTYFDDPTLGSLKRSSIRKFRTTFGNAFVEIPLGASRFHPHLTGSAGLHSVTREWAEVHRNAADPYRDEFAIHQKYPQQNVGGTTKALGLGIGLKTWTPVGNNFAVGLGARMHMVGMNASRLLESGVSVAYRP